MSNQFAQMMLQISQLTLQKKYHFYESIFQMKHAIEMGFSLPNTKYFINYLIDKKIKFGHQNTH